MNSALQQLEGLAPLFSYPAADYIELVQKAVACAGSSSPALLGFAAAVERTPVDELQELYTSTFDLQPICPMDLGWHLFGEEYDRALLLGYMRRQLRAAGISEGSELPDHISHALLLLPRMKPVKAEEFAAVIVGPALNRMLKCMPAENPFTALLRAAQQLIAFHFLAASEPLSPDAEGVMS